MGYLAYIYTLLYIYTEIYGLFCKYLRTVTDSYRNLRPILHLFKHFYHFIHKFTPFFTDIYALEPIHLILHWLFFTAPTIANW